MHHRHPGPPVCLTLDAESATELQAMENALDRACTHWGMTINAVKRKTTVSKDD